MDDIIKGLGYWRFNNVLTEDTTYVSIMKDLIRDVVSSFFEYDDPRINLEILKYKIRQFTQPYSEEKARKVGATQKQLEKRSKQSNTVLQNTVILYY